MKTSNKLILAIFLLGVLLPVMVVATIMVRYKSGSFSWHKDGSENLIHLNFAGKKQLTLRGIDNLVIYPSDSLHVTIEPRSELRVKEQQSGDSVLLFGDSIYYKYDTLQNGTVNKELITENSYDAVTLFLPPNFDLKLESCENVFLKDNNTGKPVENITLHLSNTALITTGYYQERPVPIKSLTLKMDRGTAELSPLPPITDLDVSLNQESELMISGLQVQHIRMSCDSSSILKATGDQLKKIIQKK